MSAVPNDYTIISGTQNQSYYASLEQKTKENIIQTLQFYFQNISQLGFPGSNTKTPVIREVYSDDLRIYPAIFIKTLSTKSIPMGIGQDHCGDVWSQDQTLNQIYLPGTENDLQIPYTPRVIAQRYGRMADITFNLQIWGDTVIIRNRVSDEVMRMFIQGGPNTMRDRLLKKGIVLVNISGGEEMDLPLNDTDKVFIANINLVVNAELYFDVPVPSITGVEILQGNYQNTTPDLPPNVVQPN